MHRIIGRIEIQNDLFGRDVIIGRHARQRRGDERNVEAAGGLLRNQSFQKAWNRSERSSVYRTVCVMLRWPRKCCNARGDQPPVSGSGGMLV